MLVKIKEEETWQFNSFYINLVGCYIVFFLSNSFKNISK